MDDKAHFQKCTPSPRLSISMDNERTHQHQIAENIFNIEKIWPYILGVYEKVPSPSFWAINQMSLRYRWWTKSLDMSLSYRWWNKSSAIPRTVLHETASMEPSCNAATGRILQTGKNTSSAAQIEHHIENLKHKTYWGRLLKVIITRTQQ